MDDKTSPAPITMVDTPPQFLHSVDSVYELSVPALSNEDFENLTENNITQGIYAYPTLTEYYMNPTPFVTICLFVSIFIVMLNISIFLTTVAKLGQCLRKPLLGLSIALVSLYPLVSIAALVNLLVPQIWFTCHTVMHLSFTIGAIFFYRLCMHYIGSEVSFIKETDGMAVPIRTPPCCCCCVCLPGVVPTRGRFVVLRYMVFQMVFIQGSIMLVLNGIFYNDMELFNDVQQYFLPFIIASILLGIWGLNITVRAVNNLHADYSTMKKMFSLQLIMLLCKAQYLIMYQQLDEMVLGGAYPMNHVIYKQTIINTLILVEMILLSLFVQNAYKTPVQIENDEN
ncbi:organic solute transporter alpha-like protein [Eurosta solidaginis]|uniref:organic solute transporter alpha-like protein n=1 Tax=Eurosta solidaginis TaxID=178769 RepID=UPI00353156E9